MNVLGIVVPKIACENGVMNYLGGEAGNRKVVREVSRTYVFFQGLSRQQRQSLQHPLFRPVERDIFVRDLNRQLGTPSHWLPMDSCKKEDKEAP